MFLNLSFAGETGIWGSLHRLYLLVSAYVINILCLLLLILHWRSHVLFPCGMSCNHRRITDPSGIRSWSF
jgi:hypothetical protein